MLRVQYIFTKSFVKICSFCIQDPENLIKIHSEVIKYFGVEIHHKNENCNNINILFLNKMEPDQLYFSNRSMLYNYMIEYKIPIEGVSKIKNILNPFSNLLVEILSVDEICYLILDYTLFPLVVSVPISLLITEHGKNIMENGSPEFRLVKYLEEQNDKKIDISIEDLKNIWTPEYAAIATCQAMGRKWIEIVKNSKRLILLYQNLPTVDIAKFNLLKIEKPENIKKIELSSLISRKLITKVLKWDNLTISFNYKIPKL